MVLAILLLLAADAAIEPKPGQDPFIEKTRAEVNRFLIGLPNYECRQTTSRQTRSASDVVTAVLTYTDGNDRYRDFTINGRSASQQLALRSGLWFVGDFGPLLRNVFAYDVNAKFEREGAENLFGEKVAEYRYSVELSQSRWDIAVGTHKIRSAYHGKLWITLDGARVLRVTMRAVVP